MRILINAANVTASGPVMVAKGILGELGSVVPEWRFDVLLRRELGLQDMSLPSNVNLVFVKRSGPKVAWRLADLYLRLPRYVSNGRFDACFTLGDIGPIGIDVPHFVMLHQPWILYGDSVALYRTLSLPKRLKLFYFRWHFAQQCRHGAIFTVQTPVMAQRLQSCFGLDSNRVYTIPSALPIHVRDRRPLLDPLPAMMVPQADTRLLFLASFYPHKNHRILLEIADELRASGNLGKLHFYTTIARTSENRDLLLRFEQNRAYITNLGHLSEKDVPRALSAADALFLPTLVETFGLIYLEAMACGCPILTSDLDFARWMCQDSAFYFDPTDVSSVMESVQLLKSSPRRAADVAQIGNRRLQDFPSWQEVARMYVKMIEQCLTQTSR